MLSTADDTDILQDKLPRGVLGHSIISATTLSVTEADPRVNLGRGRSGRVVEITTPPPNERITAMKHGGGNGNIAASVRAGDWLLPERPCGGDVGGRSGDSKGRRGNARWLRVEAISVG